MFLGPFFVMIIVIYLFIVAIHFTSVFVYCPKLYGLREKNRSCALVFIRIPWIDGLFFEFATMRPEGQVNFNFVQASSLLSCCPWSNHIMWAVVVIQYDRITFAVPVEVYSFTFLHFAPTYFFHLCSSSLA